mgnify:CR=1 FL=1
MGQAVHVVKRGGKRQSEDFSRDKLHASIYATCLSVRTPDGHAHETAKNVCDAVLQWCENKLEVTSADLRHQAAKALQTFHPEAAYLYKQHRLII